MSDFTPKSFTGLFIPAVPIRPTDYIHGAENNPLIGLGVRVDNPTAKWGDYRPPLQRQSNPVNGFDCNDCTGYGYCRDVASYLNYKLKNNLLPADFVAWATAKGYIQNGSFLFDPRVLGIMAGTSSAGNWLQTVADTARKMGLLPAGTLPDVSTCSSYPEYYNAALITQDIKDLGQEFLKWIDIPYQWLTNPSADDIQSALKACPLYVAICTCGGWGNPPVAWCNAGDASNHCVVEMQEPPEVILDSYPPDLKQLSDGYTIPYRMMLLTTVKEQPTMQKTIGYKKVNDATTYVLVGSCLVPVADWPAFVRLGGDSNSIVTLTDSDFAKFTVVNGDLFKSN